MHPNSRRARSHPISCQTNIKRQPDAHIAPFRSRPAGAESPSTAKLTAKRDSRADAADVEALAADDVIPAVAVGPCVAAGVGHGGKGSATADEIRFQNTPSPGLTSRGLLIDTARLTLTVRSTPNRPSANSLVLQYLPLWSPLEQLHL